MQSPIPLAKKERALEMMEYRQTPGPYYNHISFFFEPVPYDILGRLFKNANHDFWHTGNKVYEHSIDSADLGNFDYMIVETPLDKEHRKSWPVNDDQEEREMYFLELRELREKKGHIGKGNTAFEKGAKPFVGGTRDAYIKATQHPSDEDSLTLYAADVPHVMLYPENTTTPIRVVRPIRSLVIGDGALVKKPPVSSKW